jgi:hypothetical protein
MASVFSAGLMPRQKHPSPASSGSLSQIIFPTTVDLQKADDHALVIAQR